VGAGVGFTIISLTTKPSKQIIKEISLNVKNL
jgi:hypothetical protein